MNTLKPGDAEFGTFLREYRFEDWQRMDRKTKQELFSQSCIAVHSAPIGALDEITDWESVKANDVFDMSDSIEGQGKFVAETNDLDLTLEIDQSIPVKKRAAERMCRSTIEEFVQNVGTKRVQLFLDISPNFDEPGPLPKKYVSAEVNEETKFIRTFRDLDDSRQFLRRHNRDMAWSTIIHFEKLPFQWALLGTESAISVCHVDASGLATYVECAIGEKLWFIAEGSWSSIPDGENGWDVQKLKFQCVHLKPGVRL